jgi:DNA-binding CsgD family transcriptional regulator
MLDFLRCEVLVADGRLREAESLALASYDEGIVDRSAEAQAWFAWQLSKVLTWRGRVRSAARYGYEAVALHRQMGSASGVADGLVATSFALAYGGQPEEAGRTLGTIENPAGKSTHGATDILRARAWARVTLYPAESRSLLLSAADVGEKIGDLVGATTALHDLARVGYPKTSARRLADLGCQIEGPFAAARIHHATALVDRDAASLLEAAEAFAAIGADLLAAEAAADAALVWRQRGDKRAAMAALRATTLSEQCEGASTPALLSIDARVRLTPAERKTAMLAVSGRSSRQIADEARISPRTVENHLQRVYEKLGIGSRDELAEILHPLGRNSGTQGS